MLLQPYIVNGGNSQYDECNHARHAREPNRFRTKCLFYRIVQYPATAPSVNPFGWLIHFPSSIGKGEHTIYLEDRQVYFRVVVTTIANGVTTQYDARNHARDAHSQNRHPIYDLHGRIFIIRFRKICSRALCILVNGAVTVRVQYRAQLGTSLQRPPNSL